MRMSSADPIALSDPSAASPLVTAALWIEHVMLGTVATLVAVIAVASIGLLMMTGRVNVRRGATVMIGCFILFGASTIAAGLNRLASGQAGYPVEPVPPARSPPPPPIPPARPGVYDPYAGASVPVR